MKVTVLSDDPNAEWGMDRAPHRRMELEVEGYGAITLLLWPDDEWDFLWPDGNIIEENELPQSVAAEIGNQIGVS